MAEKNADIHTLAPRLSYVEDQAKWLMDNRGSGGGTDPSTLLRKLYIAAVGGSDAAGISETPWTETLVYGPTFETSLHRTIFGGDSSSAVSCQDGKGFYGRVFFPGETHWDYSETTRPLTHDIGLATGVNETILTRLRSINSNLVKSIWDTDADEIGYSGQGTIIGRILKMQEDIETLQGDVAWLMAHS
ncbi:hypothetical protein ACCT18_01185 [Rhizobium ruizarguesonis]